MSLYRKELDKIKAYVPGKPIEEVKRSLGLSSVYKLASNEIPFEPYYIKTAVLSEIKNINRYPETGSYYLRNILAKKHKVKPDQLVFGNGSDEIITLSLRALVGRDEEVIVSFPTFLIYEIQANISGLKVKKVPLRQFRYDLNAIAKKTTNKTKIIFIANPDNPTGSYLTYKEVKDFLKKIPKSVVVFFDEAYFEFTGPDFPKSLELLKMRGNTIVSRTFSKAYGLAGLRIGYCVTSSKIAAVLNKVREPFNINRFAQVCAVAGLKNKLFLLKVLKYIERDKEYLYSELKNHGLKYVKSSTNFILINFERKVDELCTYLLKKGVIVRNLKGWGLANCFRVTIGKTNENKRFLRCLNNYLKGKK